MVAASAATIAHMGGIDEIVIFVVPALIMILVLRRSERRAREAANAYEADAERPSTDH